MGFSHLLTNWTGYKVKEMKKRASLKPLDSSPSCLVGWQPAKEKTGMECVLQDLEGCADPVS